MLKAGAVTLLDRVGICVRDANDTAFNYLTNSPLDKLSGRDRDLSGAAIRARFVQLLRVHGVVGKGIPGRSC